MYDPEKSRQEHEWLRAEIEASRTPEGKAEADKVRAQRATYEALPNSTKNEREELDVFNAFASLPNTDIDSWSGVNAPSPEPDIRCTAAGVTYYVELGEITDQPMAKMAADSLKYDELRGGSYSQDRPFAYIVAKKRGKKYLTNGAPAELLLYYRTQHPPWESYFSDLLAQNMADLLSLLSPNGPF